MYKREREEKCIKREYGKIYCPPIFRLIFVIGKLSLFLLLIIDGSYRHSKGLEAERDSDRNPSAASGMPEHLILERPGRGRAAIYLI